MKDPEDPYATGTCWWWHLSQPSTELVAALAAGAIGEQGVVVDLGCGLGTEVGYLARHGWRGLGVDLSAAALERANASERAASFARADATSLPLATSSVDLLIDRGCFHYLAPGDRAGYEREARRVLRGHGRLLLRMCLTSAGEPNGLGERTIRETFSGWDVADLRRLSLASDTRTMPALMALLIPARRARLN